MTSTPQSRGRPWWIAGAAVAGAALIGAGVGIGAAIWSGGSSATEAQSLPSAATPQASAGSGNSSRRWVKVNIYARDDHFIGDSIDCTTGPGVRGYVMAADDGKRGTIFDKPDIDWTGTNPDLYTTYAKSKSVAWGHIGSRLATAIIVGAAHGTYDNHYDGAKTMEAAVSCTDDQDAAWVVVG